jgi:hypothetical protein
MKLTTRRNNMETKQGSRRDERMDVAFEVKKESVTAEGTAAATS